MWGKSRETGPLFRQLCEGPAPLSILRPETSLQEAQCLCENPLHEVPLLDELGGGRAGVGVGTARFQNQEPRSQSQLLPLSGRSLPLGPQVTNYVQGQHWPVPEAWPPVVPWGRGLPCRQAMGWLKR